MSMDDLLNALDALPEDKRDVEGGEPVWLWMDYCGTSFPRMGDPALTFDMRLGRCYELAARCLLDGDLGDGVLVHGSMRCENGQSPRMGHAWLLIGDEQELVWEPITGKCYDREEWYAWSDAREEWSYTAEEAMLAMLRSGNFGRWHVATCP